MALRQNVSSTKKLLRSTGVKKFSKKKWNIPFDAEFANLKSSKRVLSDPIFL